MTSGRDTTREQRFLTDVSRDDRSFINHVQQRLTAGAVEYNDSWQWCGLTTLLREAREESADQAGWSILAIQAADRDHTLTEIRREQLVNTLTVVSRHAAIAHETLTRALKLIGDDS